MEKREQIKNYFKTMINKPATVFAVICGICFCALKFTDDNPVVIITTILSGILCAYFGLQYINEQKNKASDSQMDLWLEDDINEVIKNRPYDKLGITKQDLVAESLLVVGPIYWNVSGFAQEDILVKQGKDGFNRYSIWTIQVFCFTENYLCSYKCHYNWIKNTYINESTNEFFYKDVVSVKTDTISSAYTLMNGQRLVHSEAFQLKLAGDEITVITNDASLNTSSVMTSKAEKAVQSIRTMLRDKKK